MRGINKITITLGPLQAPMSTLWSIICWPFRQIAGTPTLSKRLDRIEVHVMAMTEVLYMLLADHIGDWSPEKRERVLKMIANFTLVDKKLNALHPQRNPLMPEEIQRLRQYNGRASRGEPFSAGEAGDFRELAEKAAHEYGNQDWVVELLKIAFFIFALYALSELLKSK